MSALFSITRIPRIFARLMYSSISNPNINTTNLSQPQLSPSFPQKTKGVCVTLTSPISTPSEVVRHSSLYTDKGYRYLCLKLSTPSQINSKWNTQIFKLLDQSPDVTDCIFHIMLPSPDAYLSALLSNWENSYSDQPNKVALKGVVIDKILIKSQAYNEQVTVGVSSLAIPYADNNLNETQQQQQQQNELLVLNLTNRELVQKESLPAKLSYKSVLHNFLDFMDTP